MDTNLEEIDLGFVVNIATLRQVLKKMSVDGRRWWIASDPTDAIENHYAVVGYGDSGCLDRLNTLYYRVPILNEEAPFAGTEKLVLLLDSSVVTPEQPGLYMEGGRVLEDGFTDMECFFFPLKRALVAMLREG